MPTDPLSVASNVVNKNGAPPPTGPEPSTVHVPDPPSSEAAVAVVLPPPQNFKDAAAMEQLAGTLANLPGPLALEIYGDASGRKLLVRGAPAVLEQVRAQLFAVYGQVEVEPPPPEADPARKLATQSGALAAARLLLAGPEFLPIKTWREFENNDPLVAILGAFDGLAEGEVALSQVAIHGAAPEGWAHGHLEQLVRLKRRGFGGDAPMPTGSILRGIGLLVAWLIGAILVGWSWGHPSRWLLTIPLLAGAAVLTGLLLRLRNDWAGAMEDEAALKLREQAFLVEIRLFARAGTRQRAQAILARVASAYRLFDTTSGNQFVVRPVSGLDPTHLASDARRLAWSLPFVMAAARGTVATPGNRHATQPLVTLNVKELAGLWHMPVGEALELVERQTYERLVPVPHTVTWPDGAYLGVSHKGAHRIEVCLPPEALRRNIFLIGKTQSGKSTIMEHLAARLMRDPDQAVLIIDPHGDFARRAIGLAPPERADDVIYVDLSDPTQSAALNLLDVEGGADPDKVAENFVDIGKALWKNFWGPRMIVPLGYGLRALAIANTRRDPARQYTILALASLLTARPEVREAFLAREVPFDQRPDIRVYFAGEYHEGSPVFREQVISPVLSKAHAFQRSALIRRFVGQPRSTLHLFQAIRGRKILIFNTNAGILGDDLAGFVGSLLLNVMREVITRQTELPRAERARVTVLADEFQIMTGVDFGALLGELQKNGGNFVLGTQSLDNLRSIEEGGVLPGKVFAGVATLIALQANGADARYLVESELDSKRLNLESLVNLPPYHAYVKTIDDSGRRLPVYSLKIADPLEVDSAVAARVQARRRAYSAPAEEADRLSRAAVNQLVEEYALAAQTSGEVPGSSGEERAANRALTKIPDRGQGRAPAKEGSAPEGAPPHRPVDSPIQRERQAEAAGAAGSPERPKALPPVGAKGKSPREKGKSDAHTASSDDPDSAAFGAALKGVLGG